MSSDNNEMNSSAINADLSFDEFINTDEDNNSNNPIESGIDIDTTIEEDNSIETLDTSEEIEKVAPITTNITTTTITTTPAATNKITNQSTPSSTIVRLANTSQELPKKLHNLIKIAPKPAPGVVQPVKPSKTGQVLLIQGPGGTTVPVRVSNTQANTSGIQFIRTSDGNIIQVQKKPLNINQLQVNTKKILNTGVTTNNTGSLVIRTASGKLSAVVKGGTNNSGQKVFKAISSVDGQNTKLQKIIPATTVGNLAPVSTNKFMVKSVGADGKPIFTQKIVRMGNQTGALQAIQIPGKPGVQYVRVLNTPGGLTQRTTSATATATSIVKSKTTISPSPASVVIRQGAVTNNSRPVQVLVRSPKTDSYTIQEIPKNHLSTVPTLRKIESSRVHLVTKSNIVDGDKSTDLRNKIKIAELNKEIKRIGLTVDGTNQQRPKPTTTPGSSASGLLDNSKQKFVVVTQQQIRNKTQQSPLKRTFPSSEINKPSTSAKRLFNSSSDQAEIEEVNKVENEPVAPVERNSDSPTGDGSNGIQRKHCNCSKSQCLKLYCDCFANGEFCQDCNCKDCYNNLQYEDERQKAIKICLDRNPSAFKPKITAAQNQSDLRLHNKGCNCKRSGCLKNYCECYEAKIPCSSNCKCVGCKNVEDRPDLDMDPVDVNKIAQTFSRGANSKRTHDEMDKNKKQFDIPNLNNALSVDKQQPCNFITQDVVDATVQCMIAQADNCQRNHMSRSKTEKMILEELGRCLVEIIDFSIRNMEGN